MSSYIAVDYMFALRDLSKINSREEGGGGWKHLEGNKFLAPKKAGLNV